MTDLLDKERIERLEQRVVALRARVALLEETVRALDAELRRVYETEEVASIP